MATRDENMIAALLRERAGYQARGAADRVALVDEQLAHHGWEPDEDPVTDPDGGPKDRTPGAGQRTADAAGPAETAQTGENAGTAAPSQPRGRRGARKT